MQGDPVHVIGGLTNLETRLQTLVRSADRHRALRDQSQAELTGIEEEIASLGVRIEVLEQVGALFRALLDKLVLGQVKAIENVVTEGLHNIFYDKQISLQTEISQKYHKMSIDFLFKQISGTTTIVGKPLGSFGGGPSSIASFVLRLMMLLRFKRWPLMFLDETLSAVSDEYIEQTGTFLRQLTKSTGIDVLLVTHKHAFLEHSDVAYQGSEEVGTDGEPHLAIRRQRAPGR